MAGNIKGITIEIGGDTTGLDKALKGTNTAIKTTQNNLKEVNKALKLDPTNTELLEQKQRLLGDAVKATSEKLDTLKTAQEQALEQLAKGEIGQEQYDALTREIVETEAALKKATKEAENFSVGMEKAKVAVGKVGAAAEDVAKKTKALSTAAGGALAAIGGLAYKTVQAADDLSQLSQQTGISTDDLQKMQYAADLVDVSVDSITGSFTKMKKAMASGDNGKAAFETLGIAVRDADGALRDSNEVFYEVLQALSQIDNETERDTVAMEIFGKSADQLAGIIDDGGAALKAYGDEAENLGLILDGETLQGLNDVNDTIDKLKAQAGAELAKAGANALEALTPVLEKVIDKLSQLFDWIGSLDESQMQTIVTILAVIAAISPIAGIIATICGAITSFLTIWPQVQAVGTAIKAFAAANPMALVVAAVILLGTIIAANWDKIKPILDALWEKVKTVFDNVKTKIETAMEAVKGAFETVKGAITTIWEGIISAIKNAINSVLKLINNLSSKVNTVADKINGSGLAKLLGIQIPSIAQVPLLAGGGVVSSGSAIVGEAGPELVTMQNGAARVQPLATTTNTYNTINNTSRQPLQVNLVLDGMTIARKLVDPLRTAEAERGPVFVR
jgi:phage-related minor tail protein